MTSFDDSSYEPYGTGEPGESTGMTESQVRTRIAQQSAAAIHGVVRVMARPTLAMVLAPILPGLLLIALGYLAPGKVYVVTGVIGVLAILLGLRMWWLRRRIVRAAADRDALQAQILRALDLSGNVVDARPQATIAIDGGVSSVNSMNDARRALDGLGLGANLKDRVNELPRLRPFMPAALKSTFITGTFCFTAAGILTVLNVVMIIVVIIAAL
ncbi:hypothetical protein D1871_16450 [Nakamurella silvestris]|nr:hypothetical protein D1871_16450 [Nakamurella silvestris]